MNPCFSTRKPSPACTKGMLKIPLSFSKRKMTLRYFTVNSICCIHYYNLPWKKRLTVHYHFLMSKSRKIITNFWPLFTGNLLSLDSLGHVWTSQPPKRMLQRHPTTNHFHKQENSTLNLQRSCAPIYKDHVPTTQQSMVVYQYMRHCDCQYVSRTSLRLQDRINQHIPKSIRNNQKLTKILPKRICK